MTDFENDPEIRITVRTSTRMEDDMKFYEPPNNYYPTVTFTYDVYDNFDDILGDVYVEPSQQNRTLNLQSFVNSRNRDDECIICKTNFQPNDSLCTNTCMHTFHHNCLSTWVKYNPSCPICRSNIPVTSPQFSYPSL